MLALLGVPPWVKAVIGLALIGIGLGTHRTALALIGALVVVVGLLGASRAGSSA
jgi:hypothetical protein